MRSGEVFALLGPNGAGKTTTVEILEGYRDRTAGEVSVLGFDPADRSRELRRRVGIVLQSTGVDPYLTVRETVGPVRAATTRRRATSTRSSTLVGLSEKRDARVIKLSGGQQRRLDVAIALAGDPELLFLDEPTTGFDPGARRNAWDIIRNLADARQDGLPHDALHGRGAEPREPCRRHREGRDRGRGPALDAGRTASGADGDPLQAPSRRPSSVRPRRRHGRGPRSRSPWTNRPEPCTS